MKVRHRTIGTAAHGTRVGDHVALGAAVPIYFNLRLTCAFSKTYQISEASIPLAKSAAFSAVICAETIP